MHIKRSLLMTTLAIIMAHTYPSVLAETTVSVVHDIRHKLDPNLKLDDAFLASFTEKLSGRFVVSVNGTVINPGEQKNVTLANETCTVSFEFESTNSEKPSQRIRLTGTLRRIVSVASFFNDLGIRVGFIKPSTINGTRVYFSYTITPGSSVISLGDVILQKITAWAANIPDIEIDIDGMHII